MLSSDCRANRPHLGLCPEANVPLKGRPGSRDCISDAPGDTGIHLKWKQRTPLCSRVATGISWSSLGGLKGVKPPEAFGERSRPRIAARQASLSTSNSWSLLRLMSIESVMPSNHLILCHALLPPSIIHSIRVFSDDSALCNRQPKC